PTLLDDDLGLLVADVDSIADEGEGLVLELALVAVQEANRGQRSRGDGRPLRRRRCAEDGHALVVLLGQAELAVPARIGMGGTGDVGASRAARSAGGMPGCSGAGGGGARDAIE